MVRTVCLSSQLLEKVPRNGIAKQVDWEINESDRGHAG
jgi:hypothetical protein